MPHEEKEISWLAPEFIHYPKSWWWFGLAGTGVVLLIIYFLVRKDFLTTLLFLLLGIVVIYYARQPAKTLHIHLDPLGLKTNRLKIPYAQIKSFWIVYEPPDLKILNFETAAYLNRFLTLQLEDQDPVKIREFLLQYLPEDLDRGELLADKLSRSLRF